QTLDKMRMGLKSGHAGLVVLSHDTSRLCTARFDQVHLRGAAPDTESTSPAPVLLRGGIALRDGRVIVGDVKAMSDQAVRIVHSENKELRILMHEVARVIFQPLTREMVGQVLDGRNGVLMTNGDFLAGDVTVINDDRIRVNS